MLVSIVETWQKKGRTGTNRDDNTLVEAVKVHSEQLDQDRETLVHSGPETNKRIRPRVLIEQTMHKRSKPGDDVTLGGKSLISFYINVVFTYRPQSLAERRDTTLSTVSSVFTGIYTRSHRESYGTWYG